MKNQYFADKRDFWKIDLLLDLSAVHPGRRLTNIPMLTPDDHTNEGRFTSYPCGERRAALHEALQRCLRSGQRDIRHLRDILPSMGVDYVAFRDDEWFEDASRQSHFDAVPSAWLQQAVVFIDPDIGLEPRSRVYMRRQGPAKYLRYADLRSVADRASEDAVLVVYQHLQKNAHKRALDIASRLSDLSVHLRTPHVLAVHWVDLAFLVAVRDRAAMTRTSDVISEHASRHGLTLHHPAATSG